MGREYDWTRQRWALPARKIMRRRALILFVIFLALPLCGLRQDQDKSKLVVILHTKDGIPLPDQVIKLDGTGKMRITKASITDSTGRVIFDSLKPGTYLIRGGVHGILQATGQAKLRQGVCDTLVIVQDISIKEFLEMEKE